jgi:hypothetical protein
MTVINDKKIYSISIFFIILSFIYGFVTGENSAGGGEGDYDHILNNYNLIFGNSFENIDWSKYRDSRFPIDYFFFKFYLPNSEFIWRLNIFIISFFTPFFLLLTLNYKIKFYPNLAVSKKYLLLLSLIIFLSPYFRTSAYWMLRENIGYFFWILSVFFLFKSKYENFKKINVLFCSFFSFVSFYSSINLFIIPIINFFLLIDISNILSKRNYYILIVNLIFFSPLIIFYDFFLNSLQYINSPEVNRIKYNFTKIVDLYSIIFIYIIPIFFLYFSFNNFTKIIKSNIFKIISFILFYIILFWNYPNYDLLSGGAIRKLLNLLIQDQFIFKIFYLSISGLSFLMTFYFALKIEKTLLYMIIPYTFFYTFVNYVFQEYLDPLFLLFIILYSKNFVEKSQTKILYLMSYFLLFFLSSYLYYSIKL